MVGFCDLVGTDIAPVSKKTAVKVKENLSLLTVISGRTSSLTGSTDILYYILLGYKDRKKRFVGKVSNR